MFLVGALAPVAPGLSPALGGSLELVGQVLPRVPSPSSETAAPTGDDATGFGAALRGKN